MPNRLSRRCPFHRSGEHNCIPISYWFFWRRWLCVRCDGVFRTDTR